MAPPLISSLVRGSTWELYCGACERFVLVDVIKLLEHYDLYDRVKFDKSKCAACGSKLKQLAGVVISSLRHMKKWPEGKTLVVAGGGPWKRWRPV